jgi:hypothetical protein
MTDDPWHIDGSRFPAAAPIGARLEFLLGYAVLAPSGHNTQPWLFRLRGASVEVIADRRRALPVVDPQDRALAISCGAAAANLAIAMRCFGLEPAIRWLPDPGDPDLLAVVQAAGEHAATPADVALCGALTRRRTTRLPFAPDPLPDLLQREVVALAAARGTELAVITDDARRAAIAALVAQGDRIQMADPRFRRELAAWIHSRRASSRDGISFAAFGGADLLSFVGAGVIRTFDLGGGQAAKDLQLATHSPALAAFATPSDGAADWLGCGDALAVTLAALTAAGFTTAYLNQPIEVDALRPALRDASGLQGTPQLLIRAGRGPALEPAVRRPVAEVMLPA